MRERERERDRVETEQHFLTSCPNYEDIRGTFYTKCEILYP